MSAHEQMRRLLDELMGTCRNGDSLNKEKLHFSSIRVCKCFLLNCCPHEILAHTRFNLGKCPKVHDVALKADFEKSREFEYDFQVEAHQQLKNFIVESERRTQIAKLRLAAAQDALNVEKANQLGCLKKIDEKINDNIRKAENLGVIGDVEESLKLMEKVDLLRSEKSSLALEFKNSTPASHDQQKRLRVCEVCSSYLGLNDDDKRLAHHFTGRLHLGFIHIKEKFKELESLIRDRCIKQILENEFKSSQSFKRSVTPPCLLQDDKKNSGFDCSNSNKKHKSHHHKPSYEESSKIKQICLKSGCDSMEYGEK